MIYFTKRARSYDKMKTEAAKRLHKLEGIANKLKRGENVQSSVRVTHYLHTHFKDIVND